MRWLLLFEMLFHSICLYLLPDPSCPSTLSLVWTKFSKQATPNQKKVYAVSPHWRISSSDMRKIQFENFVSHLNLLGWTFLPVQVQEVAEAVLCWTAVRGLHDTQGPTDWMLLNASQQSGLCNNTPSPPGEAAQGCTVVKKRLIPLHLKHEAVFTTGEPKIKRKTPKKCIPYVQNSGPHKIIMLNLTSVQFYLHQS